MRPKRNDFVPSSGIDAYHEKIGEYLQECPGDNLAKIDYYKHLLRMAKYDEFEKLYHKMRVEYPCYAVYSEFAKYLILVKKDFDRASKVLERATTLKDDAPMWCYYFQGRSFNYYEKIAPGVLYTAIPKNASTSLKTFLLKSWHKKPGLNPHSVFGNPYFKSLRYSDEEKNKSLKILVLRDPSKRIVSYYNKNIVEEDSLAQEYGVSASKGECTEVYGLPLRPSFAHFMKNFSRYCICFNDVFHHTLPQAAYVGDTDEYDIVVDISEVDKAVVEVSNYLGIQGVSKAPHEMTKKEKPTEGVVYAECIDWEEIKNMYSDDYEMISRLSIPGESAIMKYHRGHPRNLFVGATNG